MLLNGVVNSQTVDSLYEVGTWPGFASGAVSFTFDDNCANQLAVALPMFNEYGFKMTFFTVINWGPNWAALQQAASEGHEIASHTLSHPSLGTLSYSQQETELKNSQEDIDSRIAGQECLTIAYPNCVEGDTSLCGKYYIAGRGCSGQVEPGTPKDFLNISSIICGSQGSVQTTQNFIDKMVAAERMNGWTVFLIHAIDGDNGYSPTKSGAIQGALDYLNTNRDKLRESSFVNAVRYIRERNNVSVKEISGDDTLIALEVTQTLNDSIYNYPVTVRRVLPPDWDSVSVFQNGNEINSGITELNSGKYVVFDAVPDGGEIRLKKNSITKISGNTAQRTSSPYLMQNYPNPFNPVTKIDYQIPGSCFVTLKVYDILGREISTLVSGQLLPGRYSADFDGSRLAGGTYFYTLKAGGFSSTRKFILLK